MHWYEKGRIITVVNKWFRVFKSNDKALAGNKLYTFPSRARTIFKKELLGEKLSERDIKYMDYWGIKPEDVQ